MTSMHDEACRAREEAMILAIRETFGDRALEVARRQRDLADDETFAVWDRIVAGLGG